MPTLNHIHTVRRVRNQKNRYQCIDPDCSYLIGKDLLYGKKVICPYCKNPFILKSQALKLALPHCGCISGKKENEDMAEELIAKQLLQGLDENE